MTSLVGLALLPGQARKARVICPAAGRNFVVVAFIANEECEAMSAYRKSFALAACGLTRTFSRARAE
jgi:hypothetical protein